MFFDGFTLTHADHARRSHPAPPWRLRPAAAAAARQSANARDVARRRASDGRALHRDLPRPARLRRQPQAARDAGPRALRQARDGARSGRVDGRARPPAISRSAATIAARGSRTAWRSTFPIASRRLAVLDIVPTIEHFERTDMAFALGYYHWFWFAQPHPFPENLINAAPESWWRAATSREPKGDGFWAPEALADYLAAARQPRQHHRHVRGLSCRRDDRPRARPREPRGGRKGAARCWRCGVRTGKIGHMVRAAGDLARVLRRRRDRRPGAVRALSRGGGAGRGAGVVRHGSSPHSAPCCAHPGQDEGQVGVAGLLARPGQQRMSLAAMMRLVVEQMYHDGQRGCAVRAGWRR